MKDINIIVAIDKNRAIGKENKLLYWLPNDLKRFKELTTGNTIIMGRKTYESLPNGALPNRRNIVLSRKLKSLPNVEIFDSLRDAIDSCSDEEKIFIIGGDSIYKESMSLATRLLITEINAITDGADAFFPNIDSDVWELESKESFLPDEKNIHYYSFVNYRRKAK